MKRLYTLLALCALLLPGLAAAHCTKDMLTGTWEGRANGAGTASAVVVWFTAEQKVAFSGVWSGAGSAPEPFSLPLSSYDLGWQPAPVSTSNGLCVISASWLTGGVRQDLELIWSADSKRPPSLSGVDAVSGLPKPYTMQIALFRRGTTGAP